MNAEFVASDYDEQWSRLSDYVKHNPGARHRRRLIGEAANALPEPVQTVLDVGCGLGEILIDLKRIFPGAHFSGLDISTFAIEACRNAYPDSEFHVANIVDGPLKTKFDLVVCSEVTEHLSDEQTAIANMRRMTRSGGYLIITTPHGRIHTTERSIGHLRHPTRSQIIQWLEQAGFSVERLRQWGWPGYTALKYAGNLAPSAVMDHLGQGEYSNRVRMLNNAAYHLTYWLSLPSSSWGPQFVVTARAAD